MVFGSSYARYYDAIYQKKPYHKECAYLETLLRRYGSKKIVTLLDLGCGTANHMIPLIKKGYTTTGVDASSQMLKIAAQKLDELNLKADLHHKRIQAFQLGRKFDSVLCMFSTIDYVAQKKDVLSALKNVAKHMKKNSLFVFDFWNASAVQGHYSPRKKNIYKANGIIVERSSTTRIYPLKQICEVNYTCLFKENGKPVQRDREKHVLRYFAIDEMGGYLTKVGLNVINIHPFLNIDGKIKKNTWDVTMVAKKI